jgi:membrane fusion protein
MKSSAQQVASLAHQIDLQEQVVASNRQIFEQIAKVVDRGFVSRVEFERRRQALIAAEQQLESLKQQRLSKQLESAQAAAQIAVLPIEAARGRGEIRSQQSALEQQRTQIEGERSYVVTAPISGRITAVQTAVGRVATGQTPMLVIVPQGTILRAELYAPTSAIGFVQPGQETRLLFDAFPYQRFGSFAGKVITVSQTVIDPRETDVPIKLENAVYRISVDLSQQQVTGYGKRIPLQSGMTLNATIVLERQSFLDWILTPLNAVRKRTA